MLLLKMMFRQILILVFFFASCSAFSQNVDHPELVELFSELKKTHSYRDQIKGPKERSYDSLIRQVDKKLSVMLSRFDRFYTLSGLMLPISDNHLYFYESYKTYFTDKLLADTALIANFRASPEFLSFPRVRLNLDSLESDLKNKAHDSIEGIYQYLGGLTVGIYRTPQRDSLIGVVLHSKSPIWDRGDMYSMMKEYAPSRYYVWRAQVRSKTFGLLKGEKLLNGRLNKSQLVKMPGNPTWYDADVAAPVYGFRRLSRNASYLRLGSFAGHTAELREKANLFCESIKDSLTGSLVIVDIRNNGGGSGKSSGPFVKLLRNFKGSIAVLVNNSTVSEAEQVAIELSKLKNVRTFGEATYAQITYGSNYGKRVTFAGGQYTLYITDLPDEGNYRIFEDEGFWPQVLLPNDGDWIQKVLEIYK